MHNHLEETPENKRLIEMKVEKNKMKPCNDFLRTPLTISDEAP
jgi:hypothetical protein